jgi:hypothetical protein
MHTNRKADLLVRSPAESPPPRGIRVGVKLADNKFDGKTAPSVQGTINLHYNTEGVVHQKKGYNAFFFRLYAVKSLISVNRIFPRFR